MAKKRKKTARKRAAASNPVAPAPLTRFQSDLVTRGEAAELENHGTLPQTATHAIIKKSDGTVQFKRDKFKLA